ncbi:hypothetical protein AA313_de0209926 [Arthrobotrys entomopaga]|nr:hypothetical protein AA313_de0209926 [Arthrobotrys entomopaga]
MEWLWACDRANNGQRGVPKPRDPPKPLTITKSMAITKPKAFPKPKEAGRPKATAEPKSLKRRREEKDEEALEKGPLTPSPSPAKRVLRSRAIS